MKKFICNFAIILCAVFLLSSCTSTTASEVLSVPSINTSATSVELVTKSGPIRGLLIDGVSAYKGIIYAAPPVGDLRFAPTQDVIPWT